MIWHTETIIHNWQLEETHTRICGGVPSASALSSCGYVIVPPCGRRGRGFQGFCPATAGESVEDSSEHPPKLFPPKGFIVMIVMAMGGEQ